MPMYEYQCENGHAFSQMRSISLPVEELEKALCESCQAQAALQPSVPCRPILVGAGFHQNDYPWK